MVQTSDFIYPNPVFEGSEKRIEVDFSLSAASPADGLRSLTRTQLDELMKLAVCEIVSQLSNEYFDSYVLSESSLFVYPSKFVLKTCGTTRLLNSVPRLLEIAKDLGMTVKRCKYQRASFLFPERQPSPHTHFDTEVSYLKQQFAHMGLGCSAYVLGDACSGLQWHIFVAQAECPISLAGRKPTYSLELCMTDLDSASAAQFYRTEKFISAKHTTMDTGIQDLVPNARIDDYVFEPCGYSMNGVDEQGFITIHVTPEEGFSYASVELTAMPAEKLDPAEKVAQVVDIFRPGQLVIALQVDAPASMYAWEGIMIPPKGYGCQSATCQELAAGGRTWYYKLLSNEVKPVETTGSRVATLAHWPSFASAYQTQEFSETDSDRGVSKSVTEFSSPRSTQFSNSALTGGDFELLDVLAKYNATRVPAADDSTLDSLARTLIKSEGLDDSFYLVDLGCVVRLYAYWRRAMPRVEPFYAVKCNPDKGIMAALAAAGAGFDCASEAEIEVALKTGVTPDKVVFANACKRPRDIKAARQRSISMNTFDTVSELYKMKQFYPQAEVILRIRADDPSARCQLGNKYGAEVEQVPHLLETAKELGLNVMGVSFHVGSGATNPQAFALAIQAARSAFDKAIALGFSMTLLDIGGGFMADIDYSGKVDLHGVPAAVNSALDRYFPDGEGVRIIAEPGRYFVEGCATMACCIFGKRERIVESETQLDYWIPDGLYGQFNSLLYDHAVVDARPLYMGNGREALGSKLFKSTIFGPTCDGLDTVVRDYPLPEMDNGDWLMFPNMGAYTIAGASNFNGFDQTDVEVFYICSEVELTATT